MYDWNPYPQQRSHKALLWILIATGIAVVAVTAVLLFVWPGWLMQKSPASAEEMHSVAVTAFEGNPGAMRADSTIPEGSALTASDTVAGDWFRISLYDHAEIPVTDVNLPVLANQRYNPANDTFQLYALSGSDVWQASTGTVFGKYSIKCAESSAEVTVFKPAIPDAFRREIEEDGNTWLAVSFKGDFPGVLVGSAVTTTAKAPGKAVYFCACSPSETLHMDLIYQCYNGALQYVSFVLPATEWYSIIGEREGDAGMRLASFWVRGDYAGSGYMTSNAACIATYDNLLLPEELLDILYQ